jgi:hypothetical protein
LTAISWILYGCRAFAATWAVLDTRAAGPAFMGTAANECTALFKGFYRKVNE